MGVSLRIFVAENDGSLTRVPIAVFSEWHQGEPLPMHRAGLELRVLEDSVAVDRRRVKGILRILPYRVQVLGDGRIDTQLLGRQAMRRVSFELAERRTVVDVVAELEADANYFWVPTEHDVRKLVVALFGRSPTRDELHSLLNVVFRPGVRSE